MSTEEKSRLDRLKEWYAGVSDKFKLGPHYSMERMAMIVGALVVSGSLIGVTSLWQASQADRVDIGEVASYTREFTASRTGQLGEVTGVYGDGSGTRAMVMMRFHRPSEMSSSAGDYFVHVSGIDGDASSGRPEALKQPTAGAIYSFPGTGYLGVMLEAPDGFAEQLLNLTVRAKKELVNPKPLTADERASMRLDSSFADHDQWRVVVNPAAETVVPTTALKSPTPNPRAVYAEMILRDEEQTKRRELNDHLARMKTQLDRVETFEEAMATTEVRLGRDEGVRIVPPRLPEEIAGDEITGMSSDELDRMLDTTPAEDIPDIAKKTDLARELDTDEEFMPNTYDLLSSTPVPGGMDFDWRSSTIEEGYADWVVPAGQSTMEHIMSLGLVQAPDFTMRDDSWVLTNGEDMADLSPGDPSARPLLDLRNNLLQAYRGYYSMKAHYQRDLLPSLLLMEDDMLNVIDNVSVSAGDAAVSFRM